MKTKLLVCVLAATLLFFQSCETVEVLENQNSVSTRLNSANVAPTNVNVASVVSDYGTFTIKCAIGNKFMEIAGNPAYNEKFNNQALIEQWDATTDGTWQKWQMIYKSTANGIKYYALLNLHSGKVLDVPGGATTNGLQLQQYTYFGGDQQLWKIVQIGTSDNYNIINKKTGLAVTNLNASTSNGTAIVQQTLGTGNQQNWILTSIPADTYRDDDVVNFFNRNSTSQGSVAFDEGTSIPLTWSSNNGKVLWVTQDAWDGSSLQANGQFPCNYTFSYNNSIIIQPSATNWASNAPNMTINSPMGKPKQICSNQPGTNWSWPGPGIEIGDKVYLHCGEGNGLTGTNQSLYVLTQSTGTLWTVQRTTPAEMSGQTTIGYSLGMVKAADSYVYVFGNSSTGSGYTSNIYLARFHTSNPQSWTFFDGYVWQNTRSSSAVIATSLAANSVGYVNGKYVLITVDCGFNCDGNRGIYASYSTTPTGPFSQRQLVYTIKESFQGQFARYYTPSIHPEFNNGKNELLVTYCLNYSACGVSSCQNGYIDPYYYRVKGIRIPYSKIGI